MSIVRLAWAYLAARPLATALNIAMLAVGVATMILLVLFSAQVERRLENDARPVDLVVGAKGSPLQLILSSVLHIDIPTGNIALADAQRIAANPMVASAIPLALGDTLRGFRIVGTEPAFLELYGARLAQGKLFAAPMQAVLGSEVAARTGLAVGASFTGSHGLAASGAAHQDAYTVAGVLGRTGSVIDRLVVTPLESVWEVHEDHAQGHAERPREITSLLVRYRTPLAAATLPRQINATTMMQAASPAYEGARLMNMIGVGVDTMRIFAIVLMATAALSMLAALMSALQERRYDLALLRTLGARPGTLFALVAAEGVTLVVAGVILGWTLGHAAAEVLGGWIARSSGASITGLAFEPAEAWVVLAVLAAGLATCLVPALQAYRRDPAILLKR